MIPFFAMLIYEGTTGQIVRKSTWADFARIPAEIDFPVYLSTVCWSFGGFDSVGAIAGEVKGGKKTFILALFISFPMVLLNYLLPIIVSFAAVQNLSQWSSGGFAFIAYQETHWLGIMMVIAACLSVFGQYSSGVAAVSRFVWAMSLKGDTQVLPSFFSFSHINEQKVIRPIAAIIATSAGCLAFAALPFDIIIQIYLLQRAINLTLMYAAYIRLKYPPFDTLERPFVAPGGKIMAWLWGIPTVILSIATLSFTREALVWIIGVAIQLLLVIFWIIIRVYSWRVSLRQNGEVEDVVGEESREK